MVGVGGKTWGRNWNFCVRVAHRCFRSGSGKAASTKMPAAKMRTGGFGPTEADFLYCFIATKRPRKIVQVGCGVSTAVILLAAQEAGYKPEVVCIEPYPSRF